MYSIYIINNISHRINHIYIYTQQLRLLWQILAIIAGFLFIPQVWKTVLFMGTVFGLDSSAQLQTADLCVFKTWLMSVLLLYHTSIWELYIYIIQKGHTMVCICFCVPHSCPILTWSHETYIYNSSSRLLPAPKKRGLLLHMVLKGTLAHDLSMSGEIPCIFL